MLATTSRDPEEVITWIPPTYGAATVEKVAINAVMAGSSPEHFPIILSALLATSKSGTHWEPRDQGLDGGLVSSLRALL